MTEEQTRWKAAGEVPEVAGAGHLALTFFESGGTHFLWLL